MGVITSTRNKQVSAAAKLRKRGLRESVGRFLVEGAQGTAEALEEQAVEAVFHVPGASGRVPEVVDAAARAGVAVTTVSEAVMAHLTSAVTPQGLVAVARFVDRPLDDVTPGLVPVLCSVRDPGNAGAILRSADAAGASGVVFTRASVDVYNPKTVRASAGSLFHLPVVRDVEAAEATAHLRARGARVLAATTDGEASAYEIDLTRPTALLLGNEAWGLTAEVTELADGTVRVPIRGRAESLNLAAAAALLLFEAARQRGDGAPRESAGDDLASVISAWVHDLRLPLTALKGFTTMLADRWTMFDDSARREMVEAMLLDAERISAMVGMVTDAARIEKGRTAPSTVGRDVGEAVKWVAGLFARSPDYPDVETRGTAEARVDLDRLKAVLLALCDGAMWWGQEGPIVIEARRESDGAVIELSRAGQGPTPGELVTMFASPADGGFKMGLHVARRLVETEGGSLTAEGGGEIRFRVTLPG